MKHLWIIKSCFNTQCFVEHQRECHINLLTEAAVRSIRFTGSACAECGCRALWMCLYVSLRSHQSNAELCCPRESERMSHSDQHLDDQFCKFVLSADPMIIKPTKFSSTSVSVCVAKAQNAVFLAAEPKKINLLLLQVMYYLLKLCLNLLGST